ncbi:hypothetical protein Q6272_29360, partial [Klebsiella pneumoniae]|uniref:hypothetical protein n=1 Tax=Klebsiella pneumoniae TaxID=573 RepID=UPI002731E49E
RETERKGEGEIETEKERETADDHEYSVHAAKEKMSDLSPGAPGARVPNDCEALTWVLGTKLWSSARAVYTPNY